MSKNMEIYRTCMLKEVQTAFETLHLDQLQKALEELEKAERVFCDGLGRSGLSMRGFAMRLGQMGRKSVLVGEATAPAFEKGDLLVLCTASGTSPVLLYHAQRAKGYGKSLFAACRACGRSDSGAGAGQRPGGTKACFSAAYGLAVRAGVRPGVRFDGGNDDGPAGTHIRGNEKVSRQY